MEQGRCAINSISDAPRAYFNALYDIAFSQKEAKDMKIEDLTCGQRVIEMGYFTMALSLLVLLYLIVKGLREGKSLGQILLSQSKKKRR